MLPDDIGRLYSCKSVGLSEMATGCGSGGVDCGNGWLIGRGSGGVSCGNEWLFIYLVGLLVAAP